MRYKALHITQMLAVFVLNLIFCTEYSYRVSETFKIFFFLYLSIASVSKAFILENQWDTAFVHKHDDNIHGHYRLDTAVEGCSNR